VKVRYFRARVGRWPDRSMNRRSCRLKRTAVVGSRADDVRTAPVTSRRGPTASLCSPLRSAFLSRVLRPRFVGGRSRGGYRTCSLARSESEDYRTCSTTPPREPGGRRPSGASRPTPCRQPEQRETTRCERPPALHCFAGEWRRGVGRLARQSGGKQDSNFNELMIERGYKSDVHRLYALNCRVAVPSLPCILIRTAH
jgi:hypothetical protein